MGTKTWLTAAEACRRLGVKPQTLYAYVSRGLLTADAQRGARGSLYLKSDVETLRARSRARSGHGPVAASAMRWGEPVLESGIACIQNGMLYFRGHAVRSLIAEGVAFESVAELLWSGDLPAASAEWPEPRKGTVTQDVRGASPFCRRLALWVAQRATQDTADDPETLDATLRRARVAIQGAADVFFGAGSGKERLAVKIAAALANGMPEAVSAVEAALIASADHELNASTFAARVAASTGGDFYACIQAALAAFSGRRHGLSPIGIADTIVAFADKSDVRAYVRDVDARRAALPGFGHTLYPDGDPRAAPLLARARALATKRGGRFAKMQASVDALLDEAKDRQPPNLDLGLAAVALALGLPPFGASALFALGRMAGWTAHVLEQRQQDFVLRPRARYVGRRILEDAHPAD